MLIQNTVLVILYLLLSIGLWKLFSKAGQKAWIAFVPIYNYIVWLRLIKKPWWWVFLLLVPGVNFLMLAVISVQLAKAFGKKGNIELTFAALVPYIYFIFIGFKEDVKFIGPEEKSNQPKSVAREWVDAIIFAVVAATVIRTFFIEAFTIPTSSLEKSLMVGDYLFVSKMSYGAKIPNTPLAFPFAHHTLPGTQSVKSYLEWIKIPYYRLPGFRKVKNGDYVVFNYPDGDTVALNMQDRSYYQVVRDEAENIKNYVEQNGKKISKEESLSLAWKEVNTNEGKYGKIVARPPDKRENYIKRCVAIAGDKLEIVDGEVYINDKKQVAPERSQHFYNIKTLSPIFGFNKKTEIGYILSNIELLNEFDIYVSEGWRSGEAGDTSIYTLNIPQYEVERIKKLKGVVSVERIIEPKNNYNPSIFPHDPRYPWNNDNFGPFVIPKAGTTVNIDTTTISLYKKIIETYDNGDHTVEIKNGKIIYDGQAITQYTFKQDYYWMMGDNRHNSADSRSWGVVPEDHVVGTPVFIWLSLKDPKYNPFSGEFKLSTFFTDHGKARWERFFTFVNNEGLSRSYLLHFLVIMGGIWSYGFIKRKKQQNKKQHPGNIK